MIQIYDPRAGQLVEEQVFGGRAIDWGYGTALGRALSSPEPIQRLVSRAVGAWYGTRFSRGLIAPFIERYGVDMADFAEPTRGYRSFNDFFTRPLAEGARTFPDDPDVVGAPAEGRLSVFPLDRVRSTLVVKGVPLSIPQLLGSASLAESMLGGHAFVFRLCPVDYHRFHFPVAGVASRSRPLPGRLHSVNPQATAAVPDVFLQNERQLCTLETERFGTLLLLEVGATCVGRIIQDYRPDEPVQRGQTKGWFAFGGSTTLLLSGPGALVPEPALVEQTVAGYETLVRLGDPIGRRPSA